MRWQNFVCVSWRTKKKGTKNSYLGLPLFLLSIKEEEAVPELEEVLVHFCSRLDGENSRLPGVISTSGGHLELWILPLHRPVDVSIGPILPLFYVPLWHCFVLEKEV